MDIITTAFEARLNEDLYSTLKVGGEVDEVTPAATDIEEKWPLILNEYMADGVREFQDYPMTALGWIMYVGMAVAKFWDQDWEQYTKNDRPYESLRDKRGFDYLDEYISEEVLGLDAKQSEALTKLVGNCAARTLNALSHEQAEPGTAEALQVFTGCLRQLYLMGAYVQLHRMGYRMTKLN